MNKLSQNAKDKIVDLIFSTARCYVPINDLTEEQIERLDLIMWEWCGDKCKNIGTHKAHADRTNWKISYSKSLLDSFLTPKISIGSALAETIGTTLHEIVHILFPEYDETETENKTVEWLKRNVILELYQES